jgi:hypothetical protein
MFGPPGDERDGRDAGIVVPGRVIDGARTERRAPGTPRAFFMGAPGAVRQAGDASDGVRTPFLVAGRRPIEPSREL